MINKATQLKYHPMVPKQSEAAKLAASTFELVTGVRSFTQYWYDKQNESVQTTIDLIEEFLKT